MWGFDSKLVTCACVWSSASSPTVSMNLYPFRRVIDAICWMSWKHSAVCMYVCMYVCMCMYVFMYVYFIGWGSIRALVRLCMYVQYVNMHVCTYACTCVSIYMYVCMYIKNVCMWVEQHLWDGGGEEKGLALGGDSGGCRWLPLALFQERHDAVDVPDDCDRR